MPMLSTGLTRDRRSGVYYLRRRIPSDLLICYPGKKERTFSLKTKDYRTAVERHRFEEAKLTKEWTQRRERMAEEAVRHQIEAVIRIDDLTPEVIDTICMHAEAASLAGDEARRTSDDPYTLEEIEDYKEGYVESNRLLKTAVALGDLSLLRAPLEQFLYLYRYRINASEEEMRRLTLAYGRMAIRTNQKLINRYEGQDEPTPVVARNLATPMLSIVLDSYIKHYKKLDKSAMLTKVHTVVPLMLDIIGDKPIGSLKQDDLEDYFEAVQNLPPRWKDVCRQQKISARELAQRQVGEISKATFVGTYLAVLKPLLCYCRRKWQDQGWPMSLTVEGVQYTGSRKDAEFGQRPFEPEELQRLFQGQEMANFAANPDKACMFWLPHLGLHTGARVNELCQLNPQRDIRQDVRTGIWFLDITNLSESHAKVRKTVKTSSSKRKVPIHSKLIELGFLQYVEDLKNKGEKLLFPGFLPSVGKASPKAAEWFCDMMRDIGLRDETPGARLVGMHAFRSTLLARALALRVVNAEAITGHASNVTGLEKVQDGQVEKQASSVVQTYRGELPLDQKAEILERITYDDLAFHKPVLPKCRENAH